MATTITTAKNRMLITIDNDLYSVPNRCSVKPHDSKPDVVIIADLLDDDNQYGIEIDINELTGFTFTDRADLIEQLHLIFSGEYTPVIENQHFAIHEGKHFYYRNVVTLANGESKLFAAIVNDSGIVPHTTVQANSSGEATIDIYENPTLTDNGTAATLRNRNRNKTDGADCVTLYDTPTASADGNLIEASRFGEGRDTIGQSRSDNELILKENTSYLMRITNQTTATIYVSLLFDLYEHPNHV